MTELPKWNLEISALAKVERVMVAVRGLRGMVGWAVVVAEMGEVAEDDAVVVRSFVDVVGR